MSNEPTIGPIQGKVWGSTEMPFALNGTESHCIRIKQGGYCSNHSHKTKWNRFFVISGKLKIVQCFDSGVDRDITIMVQGDVTDVPPGVRHTFEALEPTLAMEFYWSPLDSDDIDRRGTVGGIKDG